MLNYRIALTSIAATLLVAPAIAQDDMTLQPEVTESLYPEPYAPSWSDNDIALIAKQLSGSWKTTDPIENGRNDDGSVATTDLLISIAPVDVEGMSDTLYIESALADTPWAPYRQAIFQLYRYKDKVRLRTYELTVGQTSIGVYSAMWAAPEYFPDLAASQMIATLDVELEPASNGFTGSTPYPYPTGSGGAVEMTSSITLDGDTLRTADRGYDAQGNVVWGAGEESAYTFERIGSYVFVDKRTNGLAILTFGEAGDKYAEVGDRMAVDYSGYLMDGTMFDSSYSRGRPFAFPYPPGRGAIQGFGEGMEGFALNTHRKIVIPGPIGYGESGNPRAGIAPNSTLLFNVHLAEIQRAEKPTLPPPPQGTVEPSP